MRSRKGKRRRVMGEQIKVGSVVRLVGGGPAMTVYAVNEDRVKCVWFIKDWVVLGNQKEVRWTGPVYMETSIGALEMA